MVGLEQRDLAKRLLSERDASRALLVVLHHHVIPPAFAVKEFKAPFLLCLDHEEIVQLAMDYKATCIIHGHTHQPFVYKDKSGLLIISCGSLQFNAKGPFAGAVRTPSAYGIQLGSERITGVKLLKPLLKTDISAKAGAAPRSGN